ncbi:pyrroline-5-carboxylate reductase [Corynebacterium heidelbergense]|uniref:Pyrroline-5-carboxylate reductase n=1 Tax=Corynebacterium heidelbergense TaxID=2055947 RepID=A0A364V8P2_9CORY|nr:pyrroline-5-carboxylate reductase [Corynebacterium heidelbergense]RAV32936.1 pyrroline-5-carboxylate reductase [Corynebacterium heidelbergense]
MTRIGIIGGGNIGEALLSGLVAKGTDPSDITVADRSEQRLGLLEQRYGVKTSVEATDAAEDADVLINCVKPDVALGVFESVSDVVDANSSATIAVSVAAGVTLEAMESVLPAGTPVVRVMPNTPMLVGKGTSALAGGRAAEQSHLELVRDVFAKVGRAVIVKEKDIDAVTAVSGSGPAYFFLVTEAMVDAGVNLGLPRVLAEELAVSTAEGAAAMMAAGLDDEENGDGPVDLRAKVSSPGGTTSAATRALEENGIRTAFFRAMQACKDRSIELGK